MRKTKKIIKKKTLDISSCDGKTMKLNCVFREVVI